MYLNCFNIWILITISLTLTFLKSFNKIIKFSFLCLSTKLCLLCSLVFEKMWIEQNPKSENNEIQFFLNWNVVRWKKIRATLGLYFAAFTTSTTSLVTIISLFLWLAKTRIDYNNNNNNNNNSSSNNNKKEIIFDSIIFFSISLF